MLLGALLLGGARAQVTFLTLGDWGGVGIDSIHGNNEKVVAAQLTKTAQQTAAKWIVNVGDSFYYIGIKDTNDPAWSTGFEQVYTDPSLFVPWYSTLGNHDYGVNPQAQTQYVSPNKNRWVLPQRYWSHRLLLGTSGSTPQYATYIHIDSNPCILAYRSANSSDWDPPPSEAPLFNSNILSQDCATQLQWLQRQLAAVPREDWLFVVGHHPADEIDVLDFTTAMQNSTIDMYLCGHAHLLEHFTIDSKPTPYIISGAGCMVNVAEQGARPKGASAQGHSYQNVFSKVVAGFTSHTFSSDFQALETNFITSTGAVIYTLSTKKHA